jgi:hypothetical protein
VTLPVVAVLVDVADEDDDDDELSEDDDAPACSSEWVF